jgi:hypothetical protein
MPCSSHTTPHPSRQASTNFRAPLRRTGRPIPSHPDTGGPARSVGQADRAGSWAVDQLPWRADSWRARSPGGVAGRTGKPGQKQNAMTGWPVSRRQGQAAAPGDARCPLGSAQSAGDDPAILRELADRKIAGHHARVAGPAARQWRWLGVVWPMVCRKAAHAAAATARSWVLRVAAGQVERALNTKRTDLAIMRH